MFEKDLYALIRGLRNHKGAEAAYIQSSLQECRKEIRGSDMDQKATALLKLIYLEMFGHDMSWASFNVLEVMSSAKYIQKRVGYLGAVQSFRPDTEVLMLGENLLKKDLTSPHPTTISLALATIPHVVNPSMANSLLPDLLPRLSHSSPNIRKKTIVTLYRLALVFPETLRYAWPKIKERLADENEDPSVTAAIVNVVCELGWRRPSDFLPLAPRLFELLVHGGNNWMAIKIIKLFAVLTPLEPRLVKKLLPPLTSLIKTTPAMSLLYECINGIIQGGILDGSEGTVEGDEVARLCVSKLRGMLVIEGDPNLKYVALLAMTRIVNSHPALVSQHADVILECVDDPDISIRTRALELVVGMVDPTNLVPTVERLLRQLRESQPSSAANDLQNEGPHLEGIQPSGEMDDEEAAESLRRHEIRTNQLPPLPDDYRIAVINKILTLCSRDTYANVNDFDWYIGVLVELVKHCPVSDSSPASSIGTELLNVAVRVRSIRPEAVAVAQSLLLIERRADLFPSSSTSTLSVLGPCAFIAGEYATLLPDPDGALTSLTHPTSSSLPAEVLALFLQAIPKIFVRLTSARELWTTQKKAHTSLLSARIVHFLEPLILHPDLEVQERAVEYLELVRLASEAVSTFEVDPNEESYEGPLFLTQALPALFSGQELNPVAPAAIHKVPIDDALDLDQPINDSLQLLLSQADFDDSDATDAEDDTYRLYHQRPVKSAATTTSASTTLDIPDSISAQQSYQSRPLDPTEMARLKAERKERYANDPFYIDPDRARSRDRSSGPSGANTGTVTPIGDMVRHQNGDELDLESIPVMELKIDSSDQVRRSSKQDMAPRKRVEITGDETLDDPSPRPGSSPRRPAPGSALAPPERKARRGMLEVDSSGLSALRLDDGPGEGALDFERRQREEEEMARAMKEVERLRLEMQRQAERVHGEETVVKRRRKGRRVEGQGQGAGEGKKVRRKKKKSAPEQGERSGEGLAGGDVEVQGEVKKVRKKKKRQVNLDDEAGPA
ncbi:adaptin N terminal region-domain-containing protein [Elsinoe ampelina]|uniref:AP-3 complex subunit delta n=1 Tax=Elsinoe ampelina TaxID=302913 RepID=A0A6A6G7E7_9PEZI|nr:adaptin N terminal region-domain-containing protein [Elsinoe ampelina]